MKRYAICCECGSVLEHTGAEEGTCPCCSGTLEVQSLGFSVLYDSGRHLSPGEHQVGDSIECTGGSYCVVRADDCASCDLDHASDDCMNLICSSLDRADGVSVGFRKVKEKPTTVTKSLKATENNAKDVPIGDTLSYAGIDYLCTAAPEDCHSPCLECAFKNHHPGCGRASCMDFERKDERNVVFKEIERAKPTPACNKKEEFKPGDLIYVVVCRDQTYEVLLGKFGEYGITKNLILSQTPVGGCRALWSNQVFATHLDAEKEACKLNTKVALGAVSMMLEQLSDKVETITKTASVSRNTIEDVRASMSRFIQEVEESERQL